MFMHVLSCIYNSMICHVMQVFFTSFIMHFFAVHIFKVMYRPPHVCADPALALRSAASSDSDPICASSRAHPGPARWPVLERRAALRPPCASVPRLSGRGRGDMAGREAAGGEVLQEIK